MAAGGIGVVLGLPMLWSTGWLAALGGAAEGERLARMQASPQYGDGVFVNDPPVSMAVESEPSAMWAVAREYLFAGVQRTPPEPLPVRDPTPDWSEEPGDALRITWLGHSTTVVEIDGTRLLTDPVWGMRASPSTLVGPKRFHEPPVALEDLGDIDAVLISHDHYDHLDMPTIAALAETGVMFYAPLGVGAHLERWGVSPERIQEMDWWEEAHVGDVRIVATPSQHFSGRGVLDRNATLWTSWAILGPTRRVFFSGDTGLTDKLAEVGRRFGPFDATMVEIGAYHPTWGAIHLGPEGALTVHEMVRGEVLLPIHWGTFDLGLHAWAEPADTLVRLAEERGVRVATPMAGVPFEPASLDGLTSWWRGLLPD